MGFLEDQKKNNDTYYYCTKTIRFPLKSVVKVIYDFYKTQNIKTLKFNQIYELLKKEFNVKSFNRQNLYSLLSSYGDIPFSVINSLYISTNISDNNVKLYNLDLIKNVFITNSKILRKIIEVLGTEFLISISENGLLPIIDYINSINMHFNSDSKILELTDRRKFKLFDKHNSKIFIELLKTLSDSEWLEILSFQDQTKDFVDMFIEDKEIEQKKLTFKKNILFLLENVNKDNQQAKIKYLLPANLFSIFEKQQISQLCQIINISNKTAIACYDYKDVLTNLLKNLQQSIPSFLNEQFKYLLQMVNKDYKPNSLWEKYVAILESRANGDSLVKAGEYFDVTRQRVDQLESKYLTNFNVFFNSTNISIPNYIRAFVENDLFIQDNDIAKLFNFNPKLFKYLLKNIEDDNVVYIEELDKFYFVDDFDWYKELSVYGENMPQQLTAINFDSYVDKAIKILKSNDVNLSFDDCKTILVQSYRLIGNLYSKTNLNLSERFRNLLKQFYPKPVNIYDEKFLREFRAHYYDTYKDDKIKTDHSITSIIGRIGMLVGRGEYVLNDRMFMSKELANKIYQYIIESEREIFLTNTLFNIFKEELLAEGINNKYFLQGALKQRVGEKLFFRRDYVSTTKEITSIYGEVSKFIKNSNRIVTYDELQEEFVGSAWSVLMFAISQEGILNYRAKYVHVDTLKITNTDIDFLRKCVENFVSDKQIHHVNDLLTYVMLTNRQLIEKLFIEDQFALYSVLEYLFEEQFEFKRPFIAENGIVIENQTDRLKEFVNSEDELSIDSLVDFAYDNKLHMYSIVEFIDQLDNYVFKNKDSIININKTNLNKYNTEVTENIILKVMGTNDFIFADELSIYNILPKEVTWTPWLLYSALNKYGSKLKAIPSDTRFKFKNYYYAKPIIIKNNLPVTNIHELIDYLKKQTKLNDTEFYKFLKAKGLA